MFVLGLACATSQHHAAALLQDGQIVGVAEEERFVRQKGYGFSSGHHPGSNLINDRSLTLSQVMPRRAVAWLCQKAEVAFADIDWIAINGIPAKYQETYSLTDRQRPPRILQEGRYVFVPHHLSHAASAFRTSGMAHANVVTIDGRGERETACAFTARDGTLVRDIEVLVGEDGSIGGAYETVTRLLGFGPFGQGSTMALAPMGEPEFELGSTFSLPRHDSPRIHEFQLSTQLAHLARERHGPMTREHRNVAATAQLALNRCVQQFLTESFRTQVGSSLCLAGGVALNCSTNSAIASRPDIAELFISPAAHDGGTALGAALEAWTWLGHGLPNTRLRSAAMGPSYSREYCQAVCEGAGLAARIVPDITEDVAHRVADGQIVAWFEGPMEMGPRALGQRSLLADPRRSESKDRLNQMKGRESWRPFAPSILAGHERMWFVEGTNSPFMLLTFTVREDLRSRVPAILHVDGTTRPQSVHADVLPLYSNMIQCFLALTGVPMVLNTSLNAPGDPIVCNPQDAVDAFLRLGADALAIEGLLVERQAS